MPVLGSVAKSCSVTKKRHAREGADMGKSLQEASAVGTAAEGAASLLEVHSLREGQAKAPRVLRLLVAFIATLAAILTVSVASGYAAEGAASLLEVHSLREGQAKAPRVLRLLVAFIATLAAILTVSVASGYSAYAEEADDSINSVLNLGSDDPVAAQVFVLINTGLKSDPDKYGMTEDLLTYDAGTHLLTFNNTGYSGLDLSEKRETMKYALDSIASSTMTNQHRLKVYNFV